MSATVQGSVQTWTELEREYPEYRDDEFNDVRKKLGDEKYWCIHLKAEEYRFGKALRVFVNSKTGKAVAEIRMR